MLQCVASNLTGESQNRTDVVQLPYEGTWAIPRKGISIIFKNSGFHLGASSPILLPSLPEDGQVSYYCSLNYN